MVYNIVDRNVHFNKSRWNTPRKRSAKMNKLINGHQTGIEQKRSTTLINIKTEKIPIENDVNGSVIHATNAKCSSRPAVGARPTPEKYLAQRLYHPEAVDTDC